MKVFEHVQLISGSVKTLVLRHIHFKTCNFVRKHKIENNNYFTNKYTLTQWHNIEMTE